MEIIFEDTTSTPDLDEFLLELANHQTGEVSCTVKPSTLFDSPSRWEVTLRGKEIDPTPVLFRASLIQTILMNSKSENDQVILRLILMSTRQ